jgi:outer membrane biosynthesis protein TonB
LPPEAGNWTFRAYVPVDEARETDFDEPGPYPNLTAVQINDAESVEIAVELCAIDLDVSQGDGTVTVTNDEPINATVFVQNDTLQSVPVPAGQSVVLDSLAPDEYTLTAEAIDGGPATLNGQASLNVTVEPVETPTETVTPTATPTATPTPDETTASPTQAQSPTPTPTESPTPTPTQTQSPTPTPTESPTPTPTESPTPTPTESPTPTPTESPTPTPTPTPTASPTSTPTPTATPTASPTPAPLGTQTAAPPLGVDTSGGTAGVVHATTELADGLVESAGDLLAGVGDAIAGVVQGVAPSTGVFDAVVVDRAGLGYEAATAWLP